MSEEQKKEKISNKTVEELKDEAFVEKDERINNQDLKYYIETMDSLTHLEATGPQPIGVHVDCDAKQSAECDADGREASGEHDEREENVCIELSHERELLEGMRRIHDDARTLAVDATSGLQGAISEVLASTEYLKEFRKDLLVWERNFYKYTYKYIAEFVRGYWLLMADFEEVRNMVECSDSVVILERMNKLRYEIKDYSRSLERACASLGLRLILPEQGDLFCEDFCELLEGEIPDDISDIRVRRCLSPGIARAIEEGEEQIILQALVSI